MLERDREVLDEIRRREAEIAADKPLFVFTFPLFGVVQHVPSGRCETTKPHSIINCQEWTA